MHSKWQRRIWILWPTLITVVCYLLAMGIALQLNRRSSSSADRAEMASQPAANGSGLRQPEQRLEPGEIVRIQLEALADQNTSRGVLQCFAFASPGNRLVTGPLPRFAMMVKQRPYDLLVHADATVVGRTIMEDETTARVFVAALRDQEVETFVWLLSRQDKPPYVNCWMTDSVLLVSPRDRPPADLQRREKET